MLLRWHRPECIGIAQMLSKPDTAQMGSIENPVYQYDTDRMKNVHRLDDLFANESCLKRLLFVELYFIMQGHGVASHNIGPCFGKNAQTRTSVHFNKSSGRLTINGSKTYSRRSESKERTYPAQWLAKRLEWFLSQSVYVQSFERIKGHPDNTVIKFDIKFKSCYTSERIKMIEKKSMLTERQRLAILIMNLEFAIDNHDSLENLEKRLAKVKELQYTNDCKIKENF